MRPHGSAEELERRRRRAIALLQEGHRQAEVARRVGAKPTSVKRWWDAYLTDGEGGLAPRPVPGRPSKLTARQKEWLPRRLLKGAKANGFSTDLWTCPRIAAVIERHYGVRYHVDHIPRLMASLGWTCQKPEKRAIERDADAIARWVSKDWPRTKKNAARKRAHLVFIDETGFLMLPTDRRTWAPRGQTPLLHHCTRSHKKVSTIGAITISPRRWRCGLYLHWHPDQNITAEHVVVFLRNLLRHLRGPVIVVWDRLNAHRSRHVQGWLAVYDRVALEGFPPYAPELNPEEYLWSYLKYHRTANHGLFELDDIYDQARHEADDIAANPSLLRSFVRASRLPIRPRQRSMPLLMPDSIVRNPGSPGRRLQ